MKKILTMFGLVAVLTLAMNITVAAQAPIRVFVDGVEVIFPDQAPVLQDGRVLVPVRGVFEQLGFYVRWDEENEEVLLDGVNVNFYSIRIPVGYRHFTTITSAAAHIRYLDVPAQLIGGRTMVPIRLPLESAGFVMEWYEEDRFVIIWSRRLIHN